jgi:hypothetical protein
MSFRNAIVVALVLAFGSAANLAWAKDKEDQEEVIHITATDKVACMPDALRYCRDAVPNVRNVLMCFDRNREKISSNCRAALLSYGLQ